AEVREVVVGVDQPRAEGEQRHAVEKARALARRGGVGEAELAQQPRRPLRQLPAGRAEAGRAECVAAALEKLALALRIQRSPVLVAPCVAGHLMAVVADATERGRVDLGV